MKPRPSLKARALQWLAQREHSRMELRRKLLAYASQQAVAVSGNETAKDSSFSRRLPPSPELQASVDALLGELAANGHLSESRFVEARVRVRAERHGNLRIRQELAQHGLQLGPDEEQELKESEYARAKQVLQCKFGAPASDAAGRARQARFLAGRGFSADVVRHVLRDDD
jgi:regulatory protein